MGRLVFCVLGDYAELFRKNEQITKNLEKGLDIYIYIIMIPKMLIKCVETGGSLMKRMICNACGDKIYEEKRTPKPVEEVIEAG